MQLLTFIKGLADRHLAFHRHRLRPGQDVHLFVRPKSAAVKQGCRTYSWASHGAQGLHWLVGNQKERLLCLGPLCEQSQFPGAV